jgi:CheY-like chemotaxis protein
MEMTGLPLTGAAVVMKGDRERCMDAGMDGYISKPIDLEKLDDVLNACSSSHPRSPCNRI